MSAVTKWEDVPSPAPFFCAKAQKQRKTTRTEVRSGVWRKIQWFSKLETDPCPTPKTALCTSPWLFPKDPANFTEESTMLPLAVKALNPSIFDDELGWNHLKMNLPILKLLVFQASFSHHKMPKNLFHTKPIRNWKKNTRILTSYRPTQKAPNQKGTASKGEDTRSLSKRLRADITRTSESLNPKFGWTRRFLVFKFVLFSNRFFANAKEIRMVHTCWWATKWHAAVLKKIPVCSCFLGNVDQVLFSLVIMVIISVVDYVAVSWYAFVWLHKHHFSVYASSWILVIWSVLKAQ